MSSQPDEVNIPGLHAQTLGKRAEGGEMDDDHQY